MTTLNLRTIFFGLILFISNQATSAPTKHSFKANDAIGEFMPPSNDSPCDAIELSCGSEVVTSTSTATFSGLPEVCGFPEEPVDVFYKLIALPGIEYRVTSVYSSPSLDRSITAYTGSCNGPLTSFDCVSEDFTQPTFEILFEFDEVTEVYLQLKLNASSNGEVFISVNCEQTNFNCFNATPLAVNDEPTTGSNADAVNGVTPYFDACDLENPQSANYVWYRFTAPSTGRINIIASSGDGTSQPGIGNLEIHLATSCVGDEPVACNSNFTNLALQLLCGTYTPGNEYYFALRSPNNAVGTYTVSVNTTPCPPANNTCFTASFLFPGLPPINGTNVSASNSSIEGCEGSNSAVIFYAFFAPEGELTIQTGPPNSASLPINNTVISIIDNCIFPSTLACDFNSGPGDYSLLTIPCGTLNPGSLYYITVSSGGANQGAFSISASVGSCLPDCVELDADIGDSCDDGNSNTINDVVNEDCICEGEIAFTPNLSGEVDWNGNCPPTLANMRWYQPGTDTEVFSAVLTISNAGTFTIPSAPIGTYDVVFNANSYLPKGYQNQSFTQGMSPWMGGSLTRGDVNNDNAINIIDVSVLNANFGQSQGSAGFNSNADLNCDGVINITDVSLLNAGFGLTGASLPLAQ